MAVKTDLNDPHLQHETIVKNTYAIASGPMLSYLSKIHTRDSLPVITETEDLKIHIYWSFDRVFHIHFTKADGHQCDFQIHPSPRSSERVRIQFSVPAAALAGSQRKRQAIGYPYWFHRLVLLYSKTVRTVQYVAENGLPHCDFSRWF